MSPDLPPSLHVSTSALVAHNLAILRRKTTRTDEFRRVSTALSRLLAAELLADAETKTVPVRTVFEKTEGRRLAAHFTIVSVVRGGNAVIPGVLMDVLPDAALGYVNLQREHGTGRTQDQGHHKLPDDLSKDHILIFDPMLATGGSAAKSVDIVKERRARRVDFIGFVAAPEGVRRLAGRHPDVGIRVAAVDRCLDANKYIQPGLGDFSARWHGTKL